MNNMKYEDMLLKIATSKDEEAFNTITMVLKRLQQSDIMEEALEKIIDMQRQMARDRFGNESIADGWDEVKIAMEAIGDAHDYEI